MPHKWNKNGNLITIQFAVASNIQNKRIGNCFTGTQLGVVAASKILSRMFLNYEGWKLAPLYVMRKYETRSFLTYHLVLAGTHKYYIKYK